MTDEKEKEKDKVERMCGNVKGEIERLTREKMKQQLEYEEDKREWISSGIKGDKAEKGEWKRKMDQHEKAVKAYEKEIKESTNRYEQCVMSVLRIEAEVNIKKLKEGGMEGKQKKLEEYLDSESKPKVVEKEKKCMNGTCNINVNVEKEDGRKNNTGFWGSVTKKLKEKEGNL